MKTEEYFLNIEDDLISIDLDFVDPNVIPSVISLHGGGLSTKKTAKYLSPTFLELGKSVVSFDFTGHGKSSGDLIQQSLKKRHCQARAVMSYLKMNNVTLIGSSMGGHIATSILDHVDVENLILFCPATYDRDAWNLKFGYGFTELIRTENSYLRTNIPEIARRFKGNVLHIIGENDEVIPESVTEIYRNSFSNAKRTEFITIPNCPHSIHRWVQDKNDVKEFIMMKVRDFIQTSCI